MKKVLLATCIALAFGGALANDIASANKLHEARDYAGALQIFAKLAQAGNVEAQLQLGDMYGFGDGTPENHAEAAKWLNLAVAAGNKDAAATLQVLKDRAERKAQIAHYADMYDGADVQLNALGCVPPTIPAMSNNKKQILKVDAQVTQWFACYNRFTENLNRALPPGKMIPASVSGVMSNDEFVRASARMDKAYARVGAEAQKLAVDLQVQHEKWRTGTEVELKRLQVETQVELERQQRAGRGNMAETNSGQRNGK